MNNLDEQQLIEVENQYWVDMNNSLSRLEKCPDFQRVVLEGYFRDLAINQVSLLANDQTIREGKRGIIIESLTAVSHLQDHFITIKSLGTVTPDDYEDEDES
jgi:hypothetical protein